MRNTTEEVITVTINAGSTNGSEYQKLPAGKIIGVVKYNNEIPELVRASIIDGKNFEISQLQHIENYRSRNVPYMLDGKPLRTDGGQTLTVNLIAEKPLVTTTTFDFIFIYESEENF